MKEYSLNGLTWELKGFWPWVPLKGTSMEIGNELMGVTEWLPATVPGGVHYDLYRAGLIDNPYRDMNSLHAEWVENRWWVYRAKLERELPSGEQVELVFKGLDYEAIVYLNGVKLGEHAGMYHPAVFDVTELLAGAPGAELLIVLKQAPDEMGQIGRTSQTFTQKSRFNYKWDFSTRLVNVGIWDDVVLRVHRAYSLDELALRTDWDGSQGLIRLSASVRGYGAGSHDEAVALEIEVSDPSGAAVARLTERFRADGLCETEIPIAEPQLWYPNGYGEQPLYKVAVRLRDGSGTDSESAAHDERVLWTGIRRLEYAQNERSPQDALPYTFIVNGQRIYIKGANMTPLDHLYGNIAPERYEWMVQLAKHANMNMIRVWGGGIIEKPIFYELCDRHGILIWQEFIQSSSGIDNEPSKRPEFLELLAKTAVCALKDRRSHVSLAVWSGGNELMSEPNKPSTYEDETIGMLRALVEKHDPERLFLPTSASGPVQYITEEQGVSHDVHGHWKYQGNPDHYRIYGNADHLFHSEFGVDGVSSPRSIAKFLSKPHRTPVPMEESLVWRHHGEWWDTYERDRTIFGGRAVSNLETFSRCSQWMQAEGLRYILEANRRRMFEQSGSIIWQLNEPWPNVTCTNLVDYYEELKMAYYWVRGAYAPVHVSLDYRKLDYAAGESFRAPVYIHAEQHASACTVTAQVLDKHGAVHAERQFEASSSADKAAEAGILEFDVPAAQDQLFYVRLKLQLATGESATNLYAFSTAAGKAYAPALEAADSVVVSEAVSEWRRAAADSQEWERDYRVGNAGADVALHIHPEETTDGFRMAADDAYFSLFPGEERIVRVRCRRRGGELFTLDAQVDGRSAEEPTVVFRHFGSVNSGSDAIR
jgi:beta-mannosidase